MLRKLILLCILCLAALPAFASEADFEKRMARGVAALDAGNPALAQDEFRAAQTQHPDDPETALYLAIALNRAGDPAAESALKTALRLDPANPRINFELGTFYYTQKMYDEAGDYFENLLGQKPEADMKTAAEGYLATIRSRSGDKRWGATVTGGVQYDSNVPLAADNTQLPSGISSRGDMRGVINLGLTGVALRDSQQELTGAYSLYQTVHLKLGDFNLTQNLLSATYTRILSPLLTAKASAEFESILMGGTQFVNDFSLTPGLFASFAQGMTSGIEYRLRDSFFKNSGTYPTNTDRDGLSHSVILSHRQRLTETMNLRLGYTFDRDSTTVAAWSSNAHRGNAGVAITLPYALLLDASVDTANRKYDEIQTGATAIRSDTTFTGAASLTWQAGEHLGVSVGYHYTTNNSNISGYDYNRGITSLMVQGRY
jgi:tetratricopeptide (TPR) repeat protein